MINPFNKHNVTLSVSINDLLLLVRLIMTAIPEVSEEKVVIELYNQLKQKIDELNKMDG